MKEPIQIQRLIQIDEKMYLAAELHYEDYMYDPKLTAMTVLEGEDIFLKREKIWMMV